MKRYLLKRLTASLLLLFLLSIVIFALVNGQPGNPYSDMMSPNTSPELVESRLRQLGYYDPLILRYLKWLGRALRLDLGYSIKYSLPVKSVILRRAGNTLILMLPSLLISSFLGVGLGFLAALWRDSALDHLITVLSFVGVSVPVFFISLLLIRRFSYELSLFPSSGMYDVRHSYRGIRRGLDLLRHLVLPVTALSILQSTVFVRYTRSAMIEIADQEYIRAAMAKGMSFGRALFYHGLRNAMLPIATVFCMQLPALFSGALMTETVFSWPGIGSLAYDAAQNRDYPLIMGILTISAILILLSNLLADILYLRIDRRVEFKE
ncbi:putative oligopeptide ABC transporter, permease protein AppB [Oribacterium sp. oral taxon 078 str. F0263]|uniref:ABC transporter permease n=1 Tax=Oribacterium sp. oral taxon 078 TaxID=652706 RepID=UPI0003AE411E|nr:ABC transporter permease [Oribacterium sp. oral taxon 078]ERL05760.1 putative oligopeptide ABC transporter, permease protein AppB [Oribacterium sp. oral taxon 078 str. F0263]